MVDLENQGLICIENFVKIKATNSNKRAKYRNRIANEENLILDELCLRCTFIVH